MRIALDAMGGDEGTPCLVEGARLALRDYPDLEVILVGDEAAIKSAITAGGPLPEGRYEIEHASQVVDMHATPKESLRMRDSSIAVATRLVKEGRAGGLVSAGHTGASKASTLMSWRQLPGIHRPGIATDFPTRKGSCIVLDMGATVDCKPRNLVHFAIMGSAYARYVLGIDNPRVGILSIGEEESKGNELTFETHRLLSKAKGINFIGNAEGRDILSGEFDVVVADGFTGNIVLKFGESVAAWIMEEFKAIIKANLLTSLLGILIKPGIKRFKKKIDYAERGGAPLLGLNGVCAICHGRSSPIAIRNALRVAMDAVANDMNRHIEEALEENSHILNAK